MKFVAVKASIHVHDRLTTAQLLTCQKTPTSIIAPKDRYFLFITVATHISRGVKDIFQTKKKAV
jgi:hypothetical protein